MVDVQFDEPGYQTKSSFQNQTARSTPAMVNLVLKIGLAKNEKQANAVLIVIALICLILTFLVPKIFGPASQNSTGVDPNFTPLNL